jgi:hypothetical protein
VVGAVSSSVTPGRFPNPRELKQVYQDFANRAAAELAHNLQRYFMDGIGPVFAKWHDGISAVPNQFRTALHNQLFGSGELNDSGPITWEGVVPVRQVTARLEEGATMLDVQDIDRNLRIAEFSRLVQQIRNEQVFTSTLGILLAAGLRLLLSLIRSDPKSAWSTQRRIEAAKERLVRELQQTLAGSSVSQTMRVATDLACDMLEARASEIRREVDALVAHIEAPEFVRLARHYVDSQNTGNQPNS